MPRSVRLRVSLELVDEQGNLIGQAPSETWVQGCRLADLNVYLARGHVPALEADGVAVGQQAFNMCRHSYQRLATALMNRGEAA